jgi:hypothetical protein
MNDQERESYLFQKSLNTTAGMGLALMVPFQVMLMMQMRYHPTYYRPRLIRFSMMTGACGLGWFASNQSQKQNLD